MALKSFSASAPGSLFLIGEHAVLEGYPAILLATSFRITATLTPRTDKTLHIESDMLGSATCAINHLITDQRFKLVLSCFKAWRPDYPSGCTLTLTSQGRHPCGLGSSGAVTAAILGVLSQWTHTQPVSFRELFLAGQTAIQNVQGFASCADLATSLQGGVIEFDPKSQTALPLKGIDTLPLTVIYSGQKVPTHQVLAHIKQRKMEQPALFDWIYKSMGNCVPKAREALLQQDWNTLGEWLGIYQILMNQLGVNTPTLQTILEVLDAAPEIIKAKISGAGMGDCLIALHRSPPKALRLTKPAKQLSTYLGLSGLTYHKAKTDCHPKTGFTQSEGAHVVQKPLPELEGRDKTHLDSGSGFAPANIALIKYWGKRDSTLNLPDTSSLSISLGSFGCLCTIRLIEAAKDVYTLNGTTIEPSSIFFKRLNAFLDLVRPQASTTYQVTLLSKVPIAAGLASSAAGFAAVTLALDHLHQWHLSRQALSRLARRGSGSACRSLWHGFVEWQRGECADGSDSHGILWPTIWPEFRVGLLMLDTQAKPLSSREAMRRTQATSQLYASWPKQVNADLAMLKKALRQKDFSTLGACAQANAQALHGLLLSARPPICYTHAQTWHAIEQVFELRAAGHEVYFTQDAGPNLKLLFLDKDTDAVKAHFEDVLIIEPFKPNEEVILVDADDRPIGMAEKILAHQQGALHRAFSIFLMRNAQQGVEILLQKRHRNKYHSGGLWTNTCCSHPKPGETLLKAAHRRLSEELGLHTTLKHVGKFQYRHAFDNGLIEHELDHVLIGQWQGDAVTLNPEEAEDYTWASLESIEHSLKNNPGRFTPWFEEALRTCKICLLEAN